MTVRRPARTFMAIRSAAVRDAIVLVAVFAVLLGGLYLFTGNWPPAVIVESGSMMHADDDVTYGRVGTIDPGDLVLVKAVESADDVRTLVEGGTERYGKPGDVIVFYPDNNRGRTPIIHRAVAYVDVAEVSGQTQYRVRWDPDAPCVGGATREERAGHTWCTYGSGGIRIPDDAQVPIEAEKPEWDGFLTKGDNPFSNRQIDQDTALSQDEPIRLSWIEGKARAEVPWLGLIKLSFAPTYNQPECASGPTEFHFFDASRSARCPGWVAFGHAWAPKDLWVMLGIVLFLLVAVPLGYDLYKNQIAKRDAADARDEAATGAVPVAPPDEPSPYERPPPPPTHMPPVEDRDDPPPR